MNKYSIGHFMWIGVFEGKSWAAIGKEERGGGA